MEEHVCGLGFLHNGGPLGGRRLEFGGDWLVDLGSIGLSLNYVHDLIELRGTNLGRHICIEIVAIFGKQIVNDFVAGAITGEVDGTAAGGDGLLQFLTAEIDVGVDGVLGDTEYVGNFTGFHAMALEKQ